MKNQKGQTLLETLLALSAAVFILSAITSVVISSLSNTTFTKNQNLANQYAQEGLEVIRQIKSSSWATFSGLASNNCLPQSKILTASSNCIMDGIVGIFIRAIDIDHVSSECPDSGGNPIGSKVASTVFWSDGKCPAGNPYCHKVEIISCFYNIEVKPTP
ncbi:MAG: hypothetical protein HYT07_03960 [Candidatus Levybacteria bacterium]|nr:hypothetical protein [Candidatus Levybacteria bacterium]